MTANSKPVISNQEGLHPSLDDVVRRHLDTAFRKPIAAHSHETFAQVRDLIARHGGPVLLDCGCGIGESTEKLARDFPGHLVLGTDKSHHRLAKGQVRALPGNAALIRADMVDLYRLMAGAGLTLDRHYILYPNPWPKSEHLQRRWHGSPVFPDLIALGGELELRSNWRLYVEEFARALELAGVVSQVEEFMPADPLTPFERKYAASGQSLYRLTATLGASGTSPSRARKSRATVS